MAKITRQTQTVFGGTGITSNFGEFGSLAASDPTTTKSISLIQSLSAWGTGWSFATIGALIPAFQDMNSVFYCAFYQICYMLQMGIAEYDSSTTYYTYSIVQENGLLYQSLTDTNTGNDPASSPTEWLCISPVGMGASVASASSMTLGNDGNSFKITGTTNINNITIKPSGVINYLLFQGILTVNTGGNINLTNGSFTTTTISTLTIISDGTNWWEISRSPINLASVTLAGILNYGTSASSSTPVNQNVLKIAYGSIGIGASSSQAITNLPFTNAGTYVVMLAENNGSNVQFENPSSVNNSGSQCTIYNNWPSGSSTITWFAIGT